jgi:hypothetical protein
MTNPHERRCSGVSSALMFPKASTAAFTGSRSLSNPDSGPKTNREALVDQAQALNKTSPLLAMVFQGIGGILVTDSISECRLLRSQNFVNTNPFNMSLQKCAILSLVELSTLSILGGLSSFKDSISIYLVLLCLQYATIKLYYTFIFPFYVSSLRYMPGPRNHHTFIGQTLNQFRANGPYELYLSWSAQWPKAPFIRYMSFANTETLLVNSLRAHQEVLSTKCYSFVKPPFFARIVGEVTGMGLVFAEGEAHKKQRKMLNGMIPEAS